MDPRIYVVLEKRYPKKGTEDPVVLAKTINVMTTLGEAKDFLKKLCVGPYSTVFKTGRAGRYIRHGELFRVYIKRRRVHTRTR